MLINCIVSQKEWGWQIHFLFLQLINGFPSTSYILKNYNVYIYLLKLYSNSVKDLLDPG